MPTKNKKRGQRPMKRQQNKNNNNFNDSLIHDPRRDMVIRNSWYTKYSVSALQYRLNGGSISGSSSVGYSSSTANIYSFFFTLGDVAQSLITNGQINFQRVRLCKVVFRLIPRATQSTISPIATGSGGVPPSSDPYVYIMKNPEGYVATSFALIRSGMGSKRQTTFKPIVMNITDLRCQQAVTDYALSTNVYQSIPAPWFDLEMAGGLGTPPYAFQALEHQGIVVAFPQNVGTVTSVLFDIDCDYYVLWKDKTGQI